MIVLHYTGMPDAKAALARLCAPGTEVSAHYFVFEDGRVVQLVQESRRAWHAGAASWAGETDINSRSVGIEIANPGHDYDYPDFPKRQIAAVTALCRGIQTRNSIPPVRVLAHSDVAPGAQTGSGREISLAYAVRFRRRPLGRTGADYRRRRLARAWRSRRRSCGDAGFARANTATASAINGNYDSIMNDVVTAFQRHFRPARVDGVTDQSTRATLRDLLAYARPVAHHRRRGPGTSARVAP